MYNNSARRTKIWSVRLGFAFGRSLLAGAHQAIHGGGTGRPVLNNTFADELGENLLHFAGLLVRKEFGEILEVVLGLGSSLLLQVVDDNFFILGHSYAPKAWRQ